ncbi:intermembrane phospholipid transport protein YdbH family protein [Pseudomonas panipatensis]|uniref:Dicarboxylate transport n=1 Tax=Pseudomonas panipatensis TaxID=428992 RepID=A0A1G8JTK9_9PSED|nr:YdbH domain-containing protein [Pseudomonas panipatensis]SDI34546.1 Dicarboxylate transport [Pseudomonas panipatensis]SMP62242.1 Dicarboxylate transport [Pseudomonas panipatensis]
MSLPRARTLLLLLVLILASLGVGLWLGAQRLLASQGISLTQWQGLHLSWQGFSLDHLALQRQVAGGGRLDASAQSLRLGWPGRAEGRWRLSELSVSDLTLQFWSAPEAEAEAEATALPAPERVSRWLAWLPGHLALDHLSLELPCARAQRCTLNGSLQWTQLPGNAGGLSAELRQGGRQLGVNGVLRPENAAWQLNLDSSLDGQRLATLDAAWEPATRHWSGTLATPGVPPLEAIRNWLSMWLPAPILPMSLPEAGRFRLAWDTSLAGDSPWPDWAGVQGARGSAELVMQLPEPWPVPGVGSLQGDLQVAASAAQAGWQPTLLSGDLRLTDLYGDWLQRLPVGLRPALLTLRLDPGVDDEAGSVRLDLHAAGAADMRVQGRLSLAELSSLDLHWRDGRLRGQVPHLELPGLRVDDARFDLPFDGHLDRQGASLSIAAGAKLQAGELKGPQALRAGKLSAVFGKGTLQAGYAAAQPFSLNVDGPLQLAVGELRQAHLHPLAWNYQGQVSASLTRLHLQGRLQNSAALLAEVDLQRADDGALSLAAQLPEIQLAGANPWAATLADWPELLSLDSGRLSGRLDWKLPARGQAQSLDQALECHALAGIYDRSEVHGLDAHMQALLRGAALSLQLPQLRVEQLNPGVSLGPLQFQGSYATTLGALLSGRVEWQQAELQLFGGRTWLAPGGLDLAASSPPQVLHLQGLSLEEILKAYPAEGLAGSGVLDGELPVQFVNGSLRIQGGQVAARQPGILQFRSEKVRALGQSNPAMQLVASTLDDFHYERLSSTVDYAEGGRLLLGFSLSGRNPALEQGRPINLNVNLEENVPALLTSLQLSDRVSETIRKRVQERLRNRPPAAP